MVQPGGDTFMDQGFQKVRNLQSPPKNAAGLGFPPPLTSRQLSPRPVSKYTTPLEMVSLSS